MSDFRKRDFPTPSTLLGSLDGVRILELGMLIAGPFAGRLLADMGAEVIKVEPRDKPDPMRDWGHVRYRDRSLWWSIQSRNKKCITLNLRQPKGQKLLLDLVVSSDVVVENFRPGTLEGWNLGYDMLCRANERIILARISGYGQTGPYKNRPGFASVAEAMGGLRYINGFPGLPPPRLGISLGDSLAAMFAVQGILAALYRRDAIPSGKGQVIDISLMESCFALLESAVPEYDRFGKIREASGTGLKGVAPSNLFQSRDGKWVVIGANHDNVFRRLCHAMGQPQLADDERFRTHLARGEHQEQIEDIILEWTLRHEAEHIIKLLNDADVVCGPVYTIADIFEDPQFRARDMLVEHYDPQIGTFLGPGLIPKFSETPGAIRWSGAPNVGSHNREIYSTVLGMSDDDMKQLEAEGVL